MLVLLEIGSVVLNKYKPMVVTTSQILWGQSTHFKAQRCSFLLQTPHQLSMTRHGLQNQVNIFNQASKVFYNLDLIHLFILLYHDFPNQFLSLGYICLLTILQTHQHVFEDKL